jgi:hypothetical protein
MDQFLAQLTDEDSEEVDAFTDALGTFFDSRFAAWADDVGIEWDPEKAGPALTFFVAGYDADGIGHIHRLSIPGPVRDNYSPNTADRGTIWEGQTNTISRLLKGVDYRALELPVDKLSDDIVKEIFEGFKLLESNLFPRSRRKTPLTTPRS